MPVLITVVAVLVMFSMGFLLLAPVFGRLAYGQPRSPRLWVAGCAFAVIVLLAFAFLQLGEEGKYLTGRSRESSMWTVVLGCILIADLLAIFAWRVWHNRNDSSRGARWGDNP